MRREKHLGHCPKHNMDYLDVCPGCKLEDAEAHLRKASHTLLGPPMIAALVLLGVGVVLQVVGAILGARGH